MILLFALVLTFVVAVLAHRRVTAARGKRPTVWFAIAFSIGAPASFWLVLNIITGSVFTRQFWSGDGKSGGLDVLPFLIALSAVACLIPATLVTFLFERKFDQLQAKPDSLDEARGEGRS